LISKTECQEVCLIFSHPSFFLQESHLLYN
jgi:hypothetical protein